MNRLAAWAALLLAGTSALAQTPLGTAFTYQGRLLDGGSPATGVYDFRVVLFDAPVGGSQVGPIVLREDLPVSEGLFTTSLDFGPAAFAGGARWLEVSVRPGASTGTFTPLAPRQPLTPSPNAVFGATAPWTGVLAKPAGFADDTDDDVLGGLTCANGQVAKFTGTTWACAADADSGGDITAVTAGTGLSGGGAAGAVTLSANTAVLQSRVAGVCAAGSGIRTVNADGTVVCEPDDDTTYTAGAGLTLTGTVFGLADLGVTTLKLADAAVTTAKIADGTIALADLGANGCAAGQVMKSNGTTWACAPDADSGGDITAVTAGTGLSGGGPAGSVSLSVNPAVVQSRVGGTCAVGSTIQAINQDGTVVCQADGSPGAWGLTGNAGTNPATNFIGTTDAQPFELRVNGQRALRLEQVGTGINVSVNVVGGHPSNTVSPGALAATIAGGRSNDITSPNGGTIGGGLFNSVAGDRGTVAGGADNHADNFVSTVAGGGSNVASGQFATVSGGGGNTAAGQHSVVAGGSSNSAPGPRSTVSGGEINVASSTNSTVSGGNRNEASGSHSTVSGGANNDASGSASSVPGGSANQAGGDYSLAAGRLARVRDAGQAGETGTCTSGVNCGDEGTFLWADSQTTSTFSTGPNQFLVRAAGGLWFGTNSLPSIPAGRFINTTSGAHLTTGGVWTNASDAAAKENFEAVDGADLLDRLATLPISSWNYRAEDASVRHIGPTAQDFRAAFGLGADDTTVSTIDPAGIALATIQELYRVTSELRAEVDALRRRVKALETRPAIMPPQPAMSEPKGDVTGLLLAWGEGDREALDRLVPLVYEELRRVARRARRRERQDGAFQTTALVHEAYLRLVDQRRARLEDRNHFLSLAAQMMRRVLVDDARRRGAAKRGSGVMGLALDDLDVPDGRRPGDLAALDDALTRLEAFDPALSRVVELRYFGGMSLEEVAQVLGVSKTTAWRDWRAARAWLYEALTEAR